MNETEPSTQTTTFGQRMRSAFLVFLRALWRLFVIVLFIALIVAGVMYLAPRLYNQYLAPIHNSISDLEYTQSIQEQNSQQLSQELQSLSERISTLEIQGDSLESQFSEFEASTANELQNFQQSYAGALEENQQASQAVLDDVREELDSLKSAVADLEASINEANDKIEALQANYMELDERLNAEDAPVAALRREVQLVNAMEMLTRSRLFIVENNLGLAEDDIQSARDLLAAMGVPEYQVEALNAIISRLDLALENLPESPVLAAEDLELAWQLLKQGLPNEPSITVEASATPTPAP